MNAASLEGRHTLVVEDDYVIAQDVAAQLRRAGATVIGPVPSVAKALRLAGREEALDAERIFEEGGKIHWLSAAAQDGREQQSMIDA